MSIIIKPDKGDTMATARVGLSACVHKHVGWAVMFWAKGHYGGYYRYVTEGEARVDAEERERRFGVLGCHYKVKPIVRLRYSSPDRARVGGA